MIPMLSGIMEMVLRVGVIVLFSSALGFKATAFAEIAAWSGALLMNMSAFFFFLKKEIKLNDKLQSA